MDSLIPCWGNLLITTKGKKNRWNRKNGLVLVFKLVLIENHINRSYYNKLDKKSNLKNM